MEAVGGGVERTDSTNVCVRYFESQTVVEWICLFLLKTLRCSAPQLVGRLSTLEVGPFH